MRTANFYPSSNRILRFSGDTRIKNTVAHFMHFSEKGQIIKNHFQKDSNVNFKESMLKKFRISCQYIIPLFCRYSANGAKALSPSSGPATENNTNHTRLVMYMKFCKNKPVMGHSPRRRSPAR